MFNWSMASLRAAKRRKTSFWLKSLKMFFVQVLNDMIEERLQVHVLPVAEKGKKHKLERKQRNQKL